MTALQFPRACSWPLLLGGLIGLSLLCSALLHFSYLHPQRPYVARRGAMRASLLADPLILSMVNGLRKGSTHTSGSGRSGPSPRASCGASAHASLAHLREGGAATPLAPYSPRRSSRTYAIYPLSLAGLSSETLTTEPRQPRLYPRSRAPDSRNSLLYPQGGPSPSTRWGGSRGFSLELMR